MKGTRTEGVRGEEAIRHFLGVQATEHGRGGEGANEGRKSGNLDRTIRGPSRGPCPEKRPTII